MSNRDRITARPLARIARLVGVAVFVSAITAGLAVATRISGPNPARAGGAYASRRADMRSASLRGAPMERADLANAILSRADLRSASLAGADLHSTSLARARLDGADLRR